MSNEIVSTWQPLTDCPINFAACDSEEFQDTLSNLTSRFIGKRKQDKLSIIGVPATGVRGRRWTFLPHWSMFEQLPDDISEELKALNQKRNALFLPGVIGSYRNLPRFLYTKLKDGKLTGIPADKVSEETRWKYLEYLNLRATEYKVAFVMWGGQVDIAEQHRRLDTAPLQPTLRFEAAGNVIALWLLTKSLQDYEWWSLQSGLAAYFQTTFSPDNPYIPLPGYDHLSQDGARGRVQVVWWCDDDTYTVEEMRAAFKLTPNVRDEDDVPDMSEPPMPTTEETSPRAQFIPKGCEVIQEGVRWQKKEGDPVLWVMTTPLWLRRVIQTSDTREAHLELEWLSVL